MADPKRYSNIRMTLRLIIAVVLILPVIACANPVMIDGQSAIAFGIIAFWALVMESGIATLLLISSGVLLLPAFGTFFIANVLLFLFAFIPFTSRVPLWFLEPGVVVTDALLLKILASLPFLQGGDFVGVSLRRALVASLLGNAASFFVGVLACNAPWFSAK